MKISLSRIKGLINHIRKDGIAWSIRNSLVVSGLRRHKPRKSPTPVGGQLTGEDTLYAFYDMSVDPATYDVAWFCVCAEMARRERGLANLEIVIVPGPLEGLREESTDYDSSVDLRARHWRVNNLVIPCICLLRPQAALRILRRISDLEYEDIDPKNIFPLGYNPYFFPAPITHEDFAALNKKLCETGLEDFFSVGRIGRRYVDQWRASARAAKRLVVITLRYYSYHTERNSNLEAWLEFARSLDKDLYTVVFIPDTETAFSEAMLAIEREFILLREASFLLHLRLAFYEAAYVNMAALTGPTALFTLNKSSRYILLKMIVPSAPLNTDAAMRNLGYTPGTAPSYASELQRWVWETDDVEVIKREFVKFQALAEKQGVPDAPPVDILD
jgi:hypothetical protein